MALEVAERLPEKVLKMCETLIAKSDIFIRTGDFQSAKQVLHKAYKLRSTNKDDRETVEKRLRVGRQLAFQFTKKFTKRKLSLSSAFQLLHCVTQRKPS